MGTIFDGYNATNFVKQVHKTVKGGGIPYNNNPGKPNLLIGAGLSCHPDTYEKVANLLNNDVNHIEQLQLPKGWGAVTYSETIHKKAEAFLNNLERQKIEEYYLLSHSEGSAVQVYTDILAKERGHKSILKGHLSVAGLLNSSEEIAKMPLLWRCYKSVLDYHPESEVMQKLQAEGKVDWGIICKEESDGILKKNEMQSDIIQNEIEIFMKHFDLINDDLIAEYVAYIFKKEILKIL